VRRYLLVLALLASCGDDSQPSGGAKIGDPCNPRQTAVGVCPGGNNARCFSPGLSCGPGFCSQACDSQACPAGSVCIALERLNPTSAQPEVIKRCFLPCDRDSDCSLDGRLYCDRLYKICSGGAFLSNLGSTGARAANGAACVAPAPAPTDLPRLVGANRLVGDAESTDDNETALAVDGATGIAYVASNGDSIVRAVRGSGITRGMPTDPGYGGDPQLAVDAMGRVYFAHLAFPGQLTCNQGAAYPGGDVVDLEWSDDHGVTWSTPKNVAPAQYVNPDFFVDKPWLTVGAGGAVYVSFTAFPTSSTTAPNELVLAFSHDRGLTWSSSIINDTTTDRVHGRSLIMLTTDDAGALYAVWWEDAGDPLAPGGLIWMAKSTDQGASFGRNLQVTHTPDATFDDPAIAVAPDGSVVYVVYNRLLAAGDRDASDVVATFSLGGAAFPSPVKVNDDASCATHFHATAAVDPSGTLYAIWYDNRYGDGRVMWSRARKPAAATGPLVFAPNGQVTDAVGAFTTTRSTYFMGDYISLAIAGGQVYAAWTDLRAAAGMTAGGATIHTQAYLGSGPLPP